MQFGDVAVNLCSAPPFMGHEEIVLPMLVLETWDGNQEEGAHAFHHCLNRNFQPNGLENTAAVGHLSGYDRGGLNMRSFFAGHFGDQWRHVPELVADLKELDRHYAFFYEESRAPLHDAYIHRCRLIARVQLPRFYPNADIDGETRQSVTATELLAAFLQHTQREPDLRRCYSDHYDAEEFRMRYGDDEQFFTGYAIWREAAGVLRAWSRIIYLPK